eukprot:3066528-Lingulodinium_polyedra.AAC.1
MRCTSASRARGRHQKRTKPVTSASAASGARRSKTWPTLTCRANTGARYRHNRLRPPSRHAA